MLLTPLDEVIATARPGIERLKVDQYHRMIETGILREGEPIELIDGILVRKDNSDAEGDPMSHGTKHAFCVKRLQRLDEKVRPHNCHLLQQLPITLSDNREPEPDGAIVRGSEEDYLDRHPVGSDCLAVFEVADSSLDYDRDVKRPIYAAAGIAVCVIINIPERQFEVYREPDAEQVSYSAATVFTSGDTFTLDLADGFSINMAIEDYLP